MYIYFKNKFYTCRIRGLGLSFNRPFLFVQRMPEKAFIYYFEKKGLT